HDVQHAGRERAEGRRAHDRERRTEVAVRVECAGAGEVAARASAVAVHGARTEARPRAAVDAVLAGAGADGAGIAIARVEALEVRPVDVEPRGGALWNEAACDDRPIAAAEVEAAEAERGDVRRARRVGEDITGSGRRRRGGETRVPAARRAHRHRERE